MLDVDGDGKLDVVLNVTVNGEVLGYLVLTSADEVICAYGFYYRAMIGLKEDGSFSFSSSALESGVATFYKDENRDAQYNELAESKLDENENVVYFVNGEAADEDAQAAANEVRLEFAAKGVLRQIQDFVRLCPVFDEVEEEKIVQVVRPQHVFRTLFNGAVA